MRRAIVWLAVLSALSLGCSNSAPPTTGPDVAETPIPDEAAPILEAIDLELTELGVPADERAFGLYRYPRVLAAGEEVLDGDGDVVGLAPAEVVMWWADLDPDAMWAHPGRLFFADPQTGQVLESHLTTMWIEQVGSDSPWALWDGATSDAVVEPVRHEAEAAPASAPGSGMGTQQGALEEGGEECIPTRHAVLLFGGYDKEWERKAWEGNENLMVGLVQKWGVKDGAIHTVKTLKKGEQMTLELLEKRLAAINMKCCDGAPLPSDACDHSLRFVNRRALFGPGRACGAASPPAHPGRWCWSARWAPVP